MTKKDIGTYEQKQVVGSVNFGHSKRRAVKGERCFYCTKAFRRKRACYTYYGAPLCETCWDTWWRTTEDGACDPPFADIHNKSQCADLVATVKVTGWPG